MPNGHGNDIDDATVAAVGTEVRYAVDYDDNIDYFRFQAEQGRSRQIDAALGSLTDSALGLLGPDGWEPAYNDDHEDSLASRLYWEASSSGERYVGEAGYGIGTYTLAVSLVDNHGNTLPTTQRTRGT